AVCAFACAYQRARGEDQMPDGPLPFETDASTDDLSVETADLTPPAAPAPAAPRPIRRDAAPEPAAHAAADMDGRYTRGQSIGGGPLGSVHRGKHVGLGTD